MADTHDTAALVARAQAALVGTTPGPWAHKFRADGSGYIVMGGLLPGQRHKQFDTYLHRDDGNDPQDARLIASAPTLIFDMADAITAQAAEIARLTLVLDNARQIERNVQAVREHERQRADQAEAALAAALARVAVLVEKLSDTLNMIEGYNRTLPDENGLYWDRSDLITQEIMSARAALARGAA
jgi:hypothetical protein